MVVVLAYLGRRVGHRTKKVVDANDSELSSGAIALRLATPEYAPGENIEFRNLKVKTITVNLDEQAEACSTWYILAFEERCSL